MSTPSRTLVLVLASSLLGCASSREIRQSALALTSQVQHYDRLISERLEKQEQFYITRSQRLQARVVLDLDTGLEQARRSRSAKMASRIVADADELTVGSLIQYLDESADEETTLYANLVAREAAMLEEYARLAQPLTRARWRLATVKEALADLAATAPPKKRANEIRKYAEAVVQQLKASSASGPAIP